MPEGARLRERPLARSVSGQNDVGHMKPVVGTVVTPGVRSRSDGFGGADGPRGTLRASKYSSGPVRKGVLQLQRLGTRALVAETLVAQAANVQKAVTLLCSSRVQGICRPRRLLSRGSIRLWGCLPRGSSTMVPSTIEELESMDDEQLEGWSLRAGSGAWRPRGSGICKPSRRPSRSRTGAPGSCRPRLRTLRSRS
jgi:hypothetical protein